MDRLQLRRCRHPARRLCLHLNLYNVDVEDLDILFRPFLVSPGILDLVYHIQPLDSASKNSMLVVKPRLFRSLAECMHHSEGFWARMLLTVFSVVMKNWLAFVLGPALAILTV